MSKLAESERLRQTVTRAALAVDLVDWRSTFAIPDGACIPIAVFTAAYLRADGIDARVVEAGARFVDPLSKRYAEIETDGEPALEARDERGLPFLGHAIVQAPTFRAVFDLSLPTQQSKVIASLGVVDVLVGEVDHTRGQVGFRTSFGRGEAIYRIYPRRDGWRRRSWPFDEIEHAAHRALVSGAEFARLDELLYEIEERT